MSGLRAKAPRSSGSYPIEPAQSDRQFLFIERCPTDLTKTSFIDSGTSTEQARVRANGGLDQSRLQECPRELIARNPYRVPPLHGSDFTGLLGDMMVRREDRNV